jgi:RND superfamily putative drug exporter
VVTAAAIIMISVFAAFILSTDPVVKSIGLSLAFGVLADAFIVRMTFVPAVMTLLGRRAWWMPKRLDGSCPTWTSRARP